MIYPWQENQWSLISSLIQAKTLPHAILLQGSAGTGKHEFAHHLAKSVLCRQPTSSHSACGQCEACRIVDAQTHPDLINIKPLPPEKSKSKTPVLSIKVEGIRALCKKLTRTSQFEGFRVAIIEDADFMVISASNGLLKTLEEPGDDVLIILVSSKPARLPVTVRSRCRKIRFELPDTEVALSWLNTQSVIDADLALRMAHGAPLIAIALDEERLAQRKLLTKAFTASLNNEISITYAQDLSLLPKERALDWLFDWVCDLIKIKSCNTTVALVNSDCESSLLRIAKSIEDKAIFDFYDLLFESRKAVGIALNPQLFWENLLISWDNL